MSKKNKKQRLLKRSKFRYYRKTIIWTSFLIVVLYALSFWSSHQSMRISSVEINGNKFVKTTEIENIFFEGISGKYLFLISKSHFLFIPKETISKKIEKNLSIESVVIRRSDINRAVIDITEYNPVAEYCSDTEGKNCYLINESGLFFVERPENYIENHLILEGVIETENDESILGKKYTNTKTFKKLLKKIELLLEENIEINKISTEDFETFILHTIGGPTLLVEETDIPSETINNLKAAIAQESIHDVQFNNIDYIDLRFEDKVFYKLK